MLLFSYKGGVLSNRRYTAETLHITAVSMAKFYKTKTDFHSMGSPSERDAAIANRVRVELRNNAHDEKRDVVVLNAAQLYAFAEVAEHYRRTYQEPGYADLLPVDHITDAAEVRDLAAFFFWGGWLCAARRPGEDYSKNPKKKTGDRAEKPLKKKTGAEMYQNRHCPKTLIKKTGTLKEKTGGLQPHSHPVFL